MGKIKETIKRIETAVMSATFGEEGETGMARELINDERRIVLALKRDHMDKKVFRYALNLCKRIGADMDILYISSSDAHDSLLEAWLSELDSEGVNYRLEHKKGSLRQELINYTNEKKKILFAVTESSKHLEEKCMDKGRGLSEAWHNLKCPLVVVEDSI